MPKWLKDIVEAIVGSFAGALFTGLRERRRDAEQQKVGHLENENAALRAQEAARQRALEIYSGPRPGSIDGTLERL